MTTIGRSPRPPRACSPAASTAACRRPPLSEAIRVDNRSTSASQKVLFYGARVEVEADCTGFALGSCDTDFFNLFLLSTFVVCAPLSAAVW